MKKIFILFFLVLFSLTGRLYGTGFYSYFPSSMTFVSVKADRIDYDWKNKRILLKGNVTIIMDNIVIKSDLLYLDKQRGVLESDRSITLSGNGFFVSGNNIYVDLINRKIWMDQVEIILPDEKIRIRGEKLAINGKNIYVENAYFTPCECGEETPFWSIESDEINLTLGGYAWIFGGRIRFLQKKIFYLPFLIFPAKYERETGFLFPSFSYSQLRGIEFHIPFYLNISPWSEGLIQFDYYSNSGFGLTGEFNYLITRNNKGHLFLTSLFKIGSEYLEFIGEHHYSERGNSVNIDLNFALHPDRRFDLVDDERIGGEMYLPSSIEGKRSFSSGSVYGNLSFYQYIENSHFLFLPAGGFYSRPFYTDLMDGVVWVRGDIPEGNFNNRRFLLGWGLYKNVGILDYFSLNFENESVTRLKGDSLSSAGVLKVFSSLFINGHIGRIYHKIDLSYGYKWTGSDIVSSYDGWDTPYISSGFYLKWKDIFNYQDISIVYNKIMFLSEQFLLLNSITMQNNSFSITGKFTFVYGKISDIEGKLSYTTPLGIFDSGVLLVQSGNERWSDVEGFLFNPSFRNNDNFLYIDQWYFTFGRKFGRFSADVNARWMLDQNKIFQYGFSISYKERCGCFSVDLSYKNLPYKNRSTWSLQFSFGRFGSLTF